MHYAVGSNSSEIDLLDDIEEMKKGKTDQGYNLITLIDRIDGHSDDSTALGENFSDTRLYRIDSGNYQELSGKNTIPELSPRSKFDMNMGDAHVLKRFIQFCKRNYPADHYMLILRSHGSGWSMCPDVEEEPVDRLYPAELCTVLTEDESVDLLGLDVCSMAGLENAYEWRPEQGKFSADYIIASAPLSGAWTYDQILERFQSNLTEPEQQTLDPSRATPEELAYLIMEEIEENQAWASWVLIDNTKIRTVKESLDVLARVLATEPPQYFKQIIESTLGYHHNTYENDELAQLSFPYLDAYDFLEKISYHQKLSTRTKQLALQALVLIDSCVLKSYYGRGFLPETDDFNNGKNGVYLIIPQGLRIYSQTQNTFWSHMGWFSPKDKRSETNNYGLYDWCENGAIPENAIVDNFYEWLDFLFDGKADKNGYNY